METMLLEDLKLNEVEHCQITWQRERNQVVSFRLAGYIDLSNASEFEAQIQKIIALGFDRLLFELPQVNYIGSPGVGAFVSIVRKVRKRNGDLVLLNPQKKVETVLDLMGLCSFLNVMQSTKEEVLDSLFANAARPLKSFPYVFKCPLCDKRLLVKNAGTFRCPECRTVLVVNEDFDVRLR